MFYDYLDALCAERGITVTELMKELDISPSAASRWKNKGYNPSRAVAKQIADFFGLTVAELMEGKAGIKKEPAAPCDGFDEDLKKSIEVLSSFTPEYRKLVLKILEDMAAHEKAKE